MIKRAVALLALIAAATFLVPFVSGGRDTTTASSISARVHSEFQPNEGKIFVLVIGNDAREGNPDNSRADAIHIAGIDTESMRGGILNFPRDAWVSIPGHGSGRLNEALTLGGPRLLARTLENITGIRIDYWVMVGFEGFQGIVRDLGGVKLHFPQPVFDPGGSGAHIEAGTRRLGGTSSLAFVRARHSLPHGDIDRTSNQGRFLLALLRKLRGGVASSPASLLRWMAITRHHARLNIPSAELFRLGVLVSQVSASDIGNLTVPVRIGFVGAASVVFIEPEAQPIFKRFRQTARL
jgi:polyisoprenyl-teichoic acid--peptidoglycan teichoic acid transferase